MVALAVKLDPVKVIVCAVDAVPIHVLKAVNEELAVKVGSSPILFLAICTKAFDDALETMSCLLSPSKSQTII